MAQRENREWLAGRQFASVQATQLSGIIGNVANAALIAFALPTYHSPTVQGIAILTLVSLILLRANFLSAGQEEQPARAIRAFAILSTMLGLLWGISLGRLFAVAKAEELVLIGMVGAGMMYSGTLTMRSVPNAARAYLCCIAVPLATGMLMRGHDVTAIAAAALLTSYFIFLWQTVSNNFAEYLAQAEHERALHTSNETIRLLLNDYAEQGSDWLFEVDNDCRLTEVSEQMMLTLGLNASHLIGARLTDLFAGQESIDILLDNIVFHRPFRKVQVPVNVNGTDYWWSVSGRPFTIEETGEIKGIRGVITDITAEKKAEAQVSHMALYDGLTDLPNRVLFNQRLYRAVHRRETDESVAVMFLDLDQFKAVNDTLGHPTGDRLLKKVSARLEMSIGSDDLVARLGGDEFAILLHGTDARERADFVASQLIDIIGQPVDIDGQQIVPSASIGIAVCPEHGRDADTLLRNADLALYAAKHQGRNRFAFFQPGMDIAAQVRRQLELDLRAALAERQLRLAYQPLVDIESRRFTGYEALLRWEHPVRGTIMPADFIPLAEETGLIVPLGEWVIRTGLEEMQGWDEDISLSINLSPAQLKSPNLIPTVINALAQTEVDPARLEFEITESMLMQDSAHNLEILHRIRDLGVKISLDDFGTGYSSLNYLRSFPFDKIKIDRCFVAEVDIRPDCQAIIKAVTGLAASLGMTTTAEGVEHESQFEQLKEQGCTQVQGYLFSHAVSPEQVQHWRESQPGNMVVPETVLTPQASGPSPLPAPGKSAASKAA